MAKVVAEMSVSADGYTAGPDDSKAAPMGRGGLVLHDWMLHGTPYEVGIHPSYRGFFAADGPDRDALARGFEGVGAMVFGRRTYDLVDGWNGSLPHEDVPVFILTHRPPGRAPAGDTPFTFVTDGIESAVHQAKAAAGERDVWINTASACQQALAAGLVDEIRLHIAPALLGGGVRFFGEMEDAPVALEPVDVIAGPRALHVRYRVPARGPEPERP